MKKGQVEAIQKQAVEAGTLVVEEVEGRKKFRNRSLREVLEDRITSKEMTKKAVLAYLSDRVKKPSGAKEKARIEGLVKYFTDLRVKEKAAPEATSS